MAKVKFVVQGFDDRDKPFIVQNRSALRPVSARLIPSATATRRLCIFFHDVTQAYLQSKHKLTWKICIRVKEKDRETFGLKENDLLVLNKPLYELCNTGITRA